LIGRGSSRGVWIVVALLAVGGGAPRAAAAQQWHELYTDGLAALGNGQARQATQLLRRAIEERPRPGKLVPTYGTNFEPEYFPYLRLAEAFLLLEEGEEAVGALETSARFGVAPAEKRAALEARARALIDAKRPPEPPPASPPAAPPESQAAPTPEPTPAPEPPAPVTAVAPPPPETATPSPDRTDRTPPPAPTAPPAAEAERRRAPAAGPPQATPVPRATRPALVITSDPAGARVFLDDEPVGRTDPQTGRLSLRDLGAGRHRVRVSSEGHEDVIREVEIAGESVTVEARLPQRPLAPPRVSPEPAAPPGRRLPLGLVVGAVVGLILLIGLLVWGVVRQPAAPAVSAETPTFGGARADAGTDEAFPMPFGEYSLVRRIGKGGMAVVYEAERRGLTLALKRPLSGFLDDDRFRERFLREADLGRTLHHPNIIRILDRGQVERTPYLAMELIRGETLSARLDREGRLDVPEALRLTAQVAEALDYAHSKGVIHRDLKPSNIMIEASGAVKVMDYGIARAQHLEGLTTTGAFLGTPSYVAPETVEAASQSASDLYSLGVVLFEMLTGSLPFGGSTAFAVLKNHCTTPPPDPSSLNPALPAELDRLVLRLLSKDPSDRPSAEELRNELSDYLPEGQ
jgi:predicted Ser/Thr protein kinase